MYLLIHAPALIGHQWCAWAGVVWIGPGSNGKNQTCDEEVKTRLAPHWGCLAWSSGHSGWMFACLGLAGWLHWVPHPDGKCGIAPGVGGDFLEHRAADGIYGVDRQVGSASLAGLPKTPFPQEGTLLALRGSRSSPFAHKPDYKSDHWVAVLSVPTKKSYPPFGPSSKHWMQPSAIGRVLGDSLLRPTSVSSGVGWRSYSS